MNEIITNFLLPVDKFMLEMHLKQPRFTNKTGGPFVKNKEKILKFTETGDIRYLCRNELDKVYFNMIKLIRIFKTQLEEQILLNYY